MTSYELNQLQLLNQQVRYFQSMPPAQQAQNKASLASRYNQIRDTLVSVQSLYPKEAANIDALANEIASGIESLSD